MSLYERFSQSKEQGFRDDFIRPLLVQLGFMGITNKHGSQEFGKDFVFSQLDRFGHMRHMVVQAKHEESLSQGAKLDGLISQIKQAFYVPFTLPSSPTEQRYVSAVYVFNSGTITPNAVTQIANSLPREIASNTHLFSGDQLEGIAGTTAAADDRLIRDKLAGLRVATKLNVVIWASHLARAAQGVNPNDTREGFFHALEEMITSPPIQHRELQGLCFKLWQEATIIRGISQRYLLSGVDFRADIREGDFKNLVEMCKGALLHAGELELLIERILSELQPTVI